MSQINKIPPKTIDFHKCNTVIYKQCVTLNNPKMYPHTKFWIPTTNNIGDVPEVRFKVTPNSTGHSGTLAYSQSKFGIPTFKQYKSNALDTIFLELGSEEKVKSQ